MISPIIPIWLLLLILVPITIYVILKVRGIKLVIRLIMIVLVFFIDIRIKLPNGYTTQDASNLDIIFVVDNTISMQATDGRDGGKRIDDVKEDIEYIVNNLPYANYSLISFFYESEIKVPLTYDSGTLMVSVRNLKEPTLFYARGTNVTMFKKTLEQELKSSSKRDGRERVVFIMSDGENNNNERSEDLTSLVKYIDNGAVLGYGTPSGGTMKVKYSYYNDVYEDVTDMGNLAVSRIDESNLKKIASDMNLDYIYMDDTSNIDRKLDKIDDFELTSEINKNNNYADIYFYFAFVLSVLFIVEVIIDKRSL